MVEFTLNPVMLLLLFKPSPRKRGSAKGAAAALQENDHRQGIVTLA
jgi:hypothetical protein